MQCLTPEARQSLRFGKCLSIDLPGCIEGLPVAHPEQIVRSGPMSRVLSWTIIYLRTSLPTPSSAQPERGAGHTIALLFAFAPEGACQAAMLPRRWWSLTPPFQLFSHPPRRAAGVFFSAALSVGSPRLAVSQLPALWSPDFPHGLRQAAGPAIVWPTSQGRF